MQNQKCVMIYSVTAAVLSASGNESMALKQMTEQPLSYERFVG